jgi:ATP-binding cassette subfamily B protein
MHKLIKAIKMSFFYSSYTSVFISLICLADALLPALQTVILGSVIQDIWTIQEGKIELLNLLFLILTVIFSWGINQLKEFLMTKHVFCLSESLRYMLLNKASKLRYSDIENKDINDQFTRIINNAETELTETFFLVMNLAAIIIRIISTVVIVAKYSILCSLGIIILNIPLLLLAQKNGESVYEMDKEVSFFQREIDYYNDILIGKESYLERNVFDFSKWIQKKWEKSFDKMTQKYLKGFYSYFWKVNLYSIFSGIITISMIGILALFLLDDGDSIGAFMAISTNLLTLLGTITTEFTQIIREMARKKEYLQDFQTFIDLEEREELLSKPVFPYRKVEQIEFENVSFRYPNTDRDILKNFSYVFQMKNKYAIVGENGQGKTTIVKLLLGLYDNYSGNIYINGKELRSYSIAERRSFFSVLHQDFARYNLTLSENIHIGDFYAKSGDFEDLIDKLNLREMLQRYSENAVVGKVDNNNELSGGEWQKIALARTMLRKSSAYILDEPVSALDPLVEVQFYQDFDKLIRDELAILITHRLGAIKFVDNIVVISKGQVAEAGNFHELMRKEGLFYEMYDTQRGYYQ